jgi:cytochrome c oxidase subunit IV
MTYFFAELFSSIFYRYREWLLRRRWRLFVILIAGTIVLISPAFIRLSFSAEIAKVLITPLAIIVIPLLVLVFLTMIVAKEELKKWVEGN